MTNISTTAGPSTVTIISVGVIIIALVCIGLIAPTLGKEERTAGFLCRELSSGQLYAAKKSPSAFFLTDRNGFDIKIDETNSFGCHCSENLPLF